MSAKTSEQLVRERWPNALAYQEEERWWVILKDVDDSYFNEIGSGYNSDDVWDDAALRLQTPIDWQHRAGKAEATNVLLLEVLKAVEWNSMSQCVSCGLRGHASYCKLYAALKAAGE